MPASPLQPQELAEASKLKKLFVEWQHKRKDSGEPGSQEVAAALLEFGQSALSQYLNGKIPLNVDAAVKFSKLLSCQVSDFSPTMAAQLSTYGGAMPPANQGQDSDDSGPTYIERINRKEKALLDAYRLMSDEGRSRIEHLAEIEPKRELPLRLGNQR